MPEDIMQKVQGPPKAAESKTEIAAKRRTLRKNSPDPVSGLRVLRFLVPIPVKVSPPAIAAAATAGQSGPNQSAQDSIHPRPAMSHRLPATRKRNFPACSRELRGAMSAYSRVFPLISAFPRKERQGRPVKPSHSQSQSVAVKLIRIKPFNFDLDGVSPSQKSYANHMKLMTYKMTSLHLHNFSLWPPVLHSFSEGGSAFSLRSEEHTSELQSLRHLVCRL